MIGSLSCSECGTGFPGRSDALYCSPACRQKAHRARAARRLAALTEQRPPTPLPPSTGRDTRLADIIERARREQHRARDLRRVAADTQRRVLASRQRFASQPAKTPPEPPPSPWPGWPAVDRSVGGQP